MTNMRRIIIICLVAGIVGALGLSSCTKDPWVFDTSRKAGVYLLDTRDSNRVEFGKYLDTTWASQSLDVYLIGKPVDYDREVQVEVVMEDSATNMEYEKDFRVDPVFFKAGATTSVLRCWARIPENKEDENGKLHFTLRLVENENFVPHLTTKAFFAVYVFHPDIHIDELWWFVNRPDIFGPYTEKGIKVFMKYYTKQQQENTEIWQRYLLPVYGENMYLVSGEWKAEQELFLPYLKEAVLVPMFDYFTANPYPGVEIPGWYKEWKAEKD